MDAFESLVSECLWRDGYWVRQSFKVELTQEEKLKIDRHSSPRWEIDILAFDARSNVAYAVECKSYLDSKGVQANAFTWVDERSKGDRYKLFNESNTRRVVFGRLRTQLVERGYCREDTDIRLALAVGRFKNETDEEEIAKAFETRGFRLWKPDWVRGHLKTISQESYENSVGAVVAKLLLRDSAKEVFETVVNTDNDK